MRARIYRKRGERRGKRAFDSFVERVASPSTCLRCARETSEALGLEMLELTALENYRGNCNTR